MLTNYMKPKSIFQ